MVNAKGAGIEGTVLDEAGKPVADAKLGRPDSYQFGRTDENGHFVLRGINPGEFVVLAFEQRQGNYRAPGFAKKYEAKGEKVAVGRGREEERGSEVDHGRGPGTVGRTTLCWTTVLEEAQQLRSGVSVLNRGIPANGAFVLNRFDDSGCIMPQS